MRDFGRSLFWTIIENGHQIIQLVLSVNALGMGVILLKPDDTFGSSPSFIWMSHHGTEPQWAAVCLFTAMVGFYGIIAPQRWVRLLTSFLMSLYTGTLALGFYHSAPQLTGWFTYSLFTLMSYWLCWHRIWRE